MTESKKFNILVLGLYFCGKTTLINSFLGEEILPVYNTTYHPTRVITEIKYGAEKKAVIHFHNPLPQYVRLSDIPECTYNHMKRYNMNNIPPLEIPYDEIERYVVIPQGKDPQEALKETPFEKVELFWPMELLKNGVEIIDSPGLTAVESLNKVTMEYLTKADAIIFVLRAEQLCVQDEMDFIEYNLKGNGFENPFFVISRFDLIREREKEQIKEYAYSKLRNFTSFGDSGFFFVSARDALNGKMSGNNELYENSGMRELEDKLSELVNIKTKNIGDKVVSDLGLSNSSENIGEYIEFAEKLIKKYEWNTDVGKSLRERLDNIKKKQKDKNLNLSIIGEFSIGKSTFINALLRKELLESGSIQGTTVAATVIEYSRKPYLLVRQKNGQSNRFNCGNNNHLKKLISKYAADEKFAKDIDSLSVGLPSENLKHGIRIIDTPGTNALEAWHEETTERAIRELSDASIVLIDATKVLPDTQKAFIHNNLEDILAQCIFVVTKIDLVRPRERTMVLEYIKQQISYEFDLEEPFVISYASLDVLETALSKQAPDNEKLKELLEQSYKNEVQMYQYISSRKTMVQANKLMLLLEDMYSYISQNMQSISKEYQEEHELLERTKNTDLNVFAKQQISARTHEFSETAEELKYQLRKDAESNIKTYKEEIFGELDKCSSEEVIKTFTDTTFNNLCEEYGTYLLNNTASKCKSFSDAAEEQIEYFKMFFEEEYKRLGLLPMDRKIVETKFNSNPTTAITVSTGNAAEYVRATIKSTDRKMKGGVAAGAAIGTMIMPGLGTVLGGFLGAIGGAMFAESNAEIIRKTKNELSAPLNDYFDSIERLNLQNINEYISKLKKLISDEISRYHSEYNSFVQDKIQEDEIKKRQIQEKISFIKTDMQSIETIKNKLVLSRENLK